VAFVYPKLNEPDTKFNADGVYTTKAAYDAPDEAGQAFEAKVNKVRDDYFDELVADLVKQGKGAKAKGLTKVDSIKPEVDAETGDETGRMIFTAKMNAGGIIKKGPRIGQPWSQKPDYFSAAGVQLKNPPRIGGGSVGKLSVELDPYLRETDKTVGVSIKLKAVQIITLVEGGQRSFGSFGFEAEEGDDVEDQAPTGQTAGQTAGFDPNDDL
jgi:hypothetical protein